MRVSEFQCELRFNFVVGMLDNVDKAIRSKIHLIAMCFPTPRDKTTDRANSLFDEHVNLFPKNRFDREYTIVIVITILDKFCEKYCFVHIGVIRYRKLELLNLILFCLLMLQLMFEALLLLI
jgi:hypothetical protein